VAGAAARETSPPIPAHSASFGSIAAGSEWSGILRAEANLIEQREVPGHHPAALRIDAANCRLSALQAARF